MKEEKELVDKFEHEMGRELVSALKKIMRDTGGDLEKNLRPEMLAIPSMVSSVLAGLQHYENMDHPHSGSGWKNEIEEELASAHEKYLEYQKSRDATMLEMARQELNHANYYINKAKMSPDMALREKVPEYQKRYDELAIKLNAPHGAEKVGRL